MKGSANKRLLLDIFDFKSGPSCTLRMERKSARLILGNRHIRTEIIFFRAPGRILRPIFLTAPNRSGALREGPGAVSNGPEAAGPLENFTMLNCPDGGVVCGIAGYGPGLDSPATAMSRFHLNMTNTKRL